MTSKIGEVEAVIFDLDETLIDAQQGLNAAHERVVDLLQRFCEKRGLVVGRSTLQETVRQIDDEMNRKSSYQRNLWWQMVLDRIGVDDTLPKDYADSITDGYWKTYETAATPYPDAISTLEYLKKERYKLGILTDDDGIVGFKRRRILNLSFKDFFDAAIVAGDEIAERKPSPLPFLLIADKLGTSPRRCVVVGDKPFTDIKGGKSAGMLTIHVARRRWNTTIEADYQITTLSELKTLL